MSEHAAAAAAAAGQQPPAVGETRSKVVVRMIPPSLREDEFRESVGRWLGQIRWLAFEPGVAPVKNGPAGAAGAVPAHAHLKFESPTAAIEFSALVDGAPYRDCEGFESRVTVEWALSQRVPAAAGSRRGVIPK